MANKLKTVELFCGTKSFSKIAKELGHETFTVDNNPLFKPSLVCEINNSDFIKEMGLILNKILEADIIWMSPPCTTFSMASGNTHWNKDRSPKTLQGEEAKKILDYCWMMAQICIETSKIFFIENPRARARWFLPKEYRKTVWYCQYGDKRAKPTDIWTNLKSWNPKTCKNNNPDCNHERAPRGSKTGTQGIKGSKDRGIIPSKLFEEIFKEYALRSKTE